jgi:cold shock CspA family protein
MGAGDTGILKIFDPVTGSGKIQPDNGSSDLVLPATTAARIPLKPGQKVSYDLHNTDGKLYPVNIKVIGS